MFRILPFLSTHRTVGKFVQVEFGNPKKLNCDGFGICTVEMAGHEQLAQRSCCNHCNAMAHLSYVHSGNALILQFRRRDLTDKAYARHFAGGAFLIEEEFSVPPVIARACGLPQPAVFPRGRYSFKESGGRLRIKFPNTVTASRVSSLSDLPQISFNY